MNPEGIFKIREDWFHAEKIAGIGINPERNRLYVFTDGGERLFYPCGSLKVARRAQARAMADWRAALKRCQVIPSHG